MELVPSGSSFGPSPARLVNVAPFEAGIAAGVHDVRNLDGTIPSSANEGRPCNAVQGRLLDRDLHPQ